MKERVSLFYLFEMPMLDVSERRRRASIGEKEMPIPLNAIFRRRERERERCCPPIFLPPSLPLSSFFYCAKLATFFFPS